SGGGGRGRGGGVGGGGGRGVEGLGEGGPPLGGDARESVEGLAGVEGDVHVEELGQLEVELGLLAVVLGGNLLEVELAHPLRVQGHHGECAGPAHVGGDVLEQLGVPGGARDQDEITLLHARAVV